MNPDVLQALVKWLEELAGYDPSEPVNTEDELREWASHVARCEQHRITDVDYEAVRGLIDDLAPPDRKAREARRAKKLEKRGMDPLQAVLTRSEQLQALPLHGAAARKLIG